jgi:hypothetical protein
MPRDRIESRAAASVSRLLLSADDWIFLSLSREAISVRSAKRMSRFLWSAERSPRAVDN